jgi:hypothetical protein
VSKQDQWGKFWGKTDWLSEGCSPEQPKKSARQETRPPKQPKNQREKIASRRAALLSSRKPVRKTDRFLEGGSPEPPKNRVEKKDISARRETSPPKENSTKQVEVKFVTATKVCTSSFSQEAALGWLNR